MDQRIRLVSEWLSGDYTKSQLPPEGTLQVVKVENPDLQARMKNLKVGQTVDAIYTEVLRIETSR
ncbi:hypothetical protein [Pseudomonas sp. NPDC090592]|uniref:hypothetical protein n=1 Tax=Pseudomonas sp. NPDC090592 TaxID=3364480 RepID=UPI00383AA21F